MGRPKKATPESEGEPAYVPPARRPMLPVRRGPRGRYLHDRNLITLTNDEGGHCTGYVLTEAGYAKVAELASEGVSLAIIAAALGIDPKTFGLIRQRDERAQEAIDIGRQALATEIASHLTKHMREGNLTATIFLAKSVGGYTEQSGVLPDATPKPVSVNVNISIPAPRPLAEVERLIGRAPDVVDVELIEAHAPPDNQEGNE